MKIVQAKGPDYLKAICLNFLPSVIQDYFLENGL
jgi:hypothetical protein